MNASRLGPAASSTGLTVEGTLAWLAAGLGAADADAVHDTIGAWARLLPPGGDAGRELHELGAQVGRALRVRRAAPGGPPGYDDLRPDVALVRLEGHELLLAALLVAVGQRAGLPLAVLAGRRHTLVTHDGLHGPLVLSPRHQSRLISRHAFGSRFTRLEPPALAATLLAHVDARASALGDSTMHRRVRTLRHVRPTVESHRA